MLHTSDSTLLRGRLRRNVDPPEDTEQCSPEDKEEPVPAERPVGLEERDAVDQHSEGGESAHNFSEDPFAVGVGMCFVRVVKVDAVETTDGECED